jgi:4-amino-4-deoxy-L-arabinose transferase-like glycosyltransferase
LARVATFTRYALAGAALGYVGLYLVVAVARIGYPFELEWMEGAVANHVLRILNHQPLYAAPSLEFAPFIYAPLYFFVAAGAARVLGFSLFSLRLVSFAASLACLALIYFMVRRETRSRLYGLVAVGLFAATYRATGAWLDIARPDSLFLALLLAGLYLARFGSSFLELAGSGLLFALAFHTKQTALLVALPVMVASLAARRGRSLALVGAFLLFSLGAVPLLNSAFHGWYSYYVYNLPSHQPVLPRIAATFWGRVLLTMPVALALTAGLALRRIRVDPGTRLFYLLAGSGLAVAAWAGRVHRGGYINALLPAYAGLAILGTLSAWVLVRDARVKLLPAAVYIGLLLQLGRLWYNPVEQIPTRQDERAGKDLVATIARCPGEVFMPQHGYLPELAGKRSFAHEMGVCDLLDAGPDDVGYRLLSELDEAVRRHRFSVIFLDRPCIVQGAVDVHYVCRGTVFGSKDVFWTRTGMRTRPELIYVPGAASAVQLETRASQQPARTDD